MAMFIDQDCLCVDGPWAGQSVFLTGGVKETLFFSCKGEHGRYVRDPIEGKLYWEKSNDNNPI